MDAITRSICCLGCAALLAGCISPQYTKLPTLRPSPPSDQDLVYHNPLPDRDAGPAIDLPRGYDRQRSEPTRSLERAKITNEILRKNGDGTSNDPSASKYPASVNE